MSDTAADTRDASTLLDVEHACRNLAGRQALDDVDLTVGGGECVALLGPNGAGKTTLMRAIAGRLRLDSGRIRVSGRDPSSDRQARRVLGIVPQSIALYPQLTVRQNLDVLGRLSGLKGSAIESAITVALQRARLVDRAGDPVATLSGGMQRRINIVAGTLHDPQLLLLDEPTVGVDARAREGIRQLLDELREDGMGLLLTTHDFEQAATMADRVAFMARGRKVLDGRVPDVIRQFFGDAKEAVVVLERSATVGARRILESHGLHETPDERVWVGPLSGGYARLADLERDLDNEAVQVVEMRIKEAGLDGVFMQLTGEGAMQ